MCDDLLAHHHRISAPSSIPLSSNPTWFTTQPYKPTDAPPRTYLFLPLSFSIDPVACLSTSPAATYLERRDRKQTTTSSSSSAPGNALAETTNFDYFPSFFEINKRWTIYAFDKSVLALYPQKADRCEMIYELVYLHAGQPHHHIHHHHNQHSHHHHHHNQLQHAVHAHAQTPPRAGRHGYGSTPHSRSGSPGPGTHHHHHHHHPPTLNLTQSYELVEDTEWFTSTYPSRRTLLSNGEKCLSIIDLHSPPNHKKRAGYLLLLLPTPSSPSRIYIPEIHIFPEYRGAGGVGHWSIVGQGLVKMLLEAVVEVAGDIAEASSAVLGGSGVDVWMNLSAEGDTECVRIAMGMGWVVNRCLWCVERNEVEENEGQKGNPVNVTAVSASSQAPKVEVQQKQEEVDAGEKVEQVQEPIARQDGPAAVAVNGKQGKQAKHWSFGDWGKGMKGWRERWVKALDDISHGHKA